MNFSGLLASAGRVSAELEDTRSCGTRLLIEVEMARSVSSFSLISLEGLRIGDLEVPLKERMKDFTADEDDVSLSGLAESPSESDGESISAIGVLMRGLC